MAAEPQSVPSTSTTASTPALDSGSLYASFHDFPFDADPGFLSGLSNILGHPGAPVTDAEFNQKPDLVLQAKCFYYNRMFRPPTAIDVVGYKRWLAAQEKTLTSVPRSVPASSTGPSDTAIAPAESHPQPQPQSRSSSSTPTTTSPTPDTDTAATPPPPPYPISFAAIVDLITNNKPVPGIQEIPSTVLELGSSKRDTASRRRKPWEKQDDDDSDSDLKPISEAHNLDVSSLAISAEQARGEDDTPTPLSSSSLLHHNPGGKEGARTDASADPDAEAGQGEESEYFSEMSRYRRGKGEGLLRLLRPDAVPDSGLVAKD